MEAVSVEILQGTETQTSHRSLEARIRFGASQTRQSFTVYVYVTQSLQHGRGWSEPVVSLSTEGSMYADCWSHIHRGVEEVIAEFRRRWPFPT